MLFNSLEFALFLPVVFLLNWFVTQRNLQAQNVLLLVASYVFYGWWDWRFLSLIIFSSLVDYMVGLAMHSETRPPRRKLLLGVSLTVNLGLLLFFKYYNFFVQSFVDAFTLFGQPLEARFLNIILPIGISFYTFQTLSYSIDVYRRKLEPTRDALAFFAFVSFFPQLVAGPIERATNLLPQFYRQRTFDPKAAADGLRQILWGLVKKVVIADTAAVHANEIFSNYGDYGSPMLILGAIYFTFQIYGDFSGYSDIAIGTARLFGFSLMRNFAFPYFSRDMAEFWRRWHISLSTWFRDYLYIPLGGSRTTKAKAVRNTFIIFLVSGFWHGANWTFLVWGALNALYFLPLQLTNRNRKHLDNTSEGRLLPSLREVWQIGITFMLTVLAWVFFRAENLSHALHYLEGIANFSFYPFVFNKFYALPQVALLVGWEWVMRHKQHGLEVEHLPRYVRWVLYLVLAWSVLYFFGDQQEFIYFQF
ncbi:MAG: MBOAT family O-acyltransferase [Bacteroidota bacterium]